jgi:hypothetical protein
MDQKQFEETLLVRIGELQKALDEEREHLWTIEGRKAECEEMLAWTKAQNMMP